MAELVLGVGMSHSPMIVTDEVDLWRRFGVVDQHSTFLRDTSGTSVTYADLEQENGTRFADQTGDAHLGDQAEAVGRALDRLRADVAETRPDVFVVIGDDQMELHDIDNMPALGVFYGPDLVMATRSRFATYYEDMSDVMPRLSAGFGMDERHVWPGHEPLARHLIASLIEQRFDVGAMAEVGDDPAYGIGHAFGVVEAQLNGDDKLPLVPLYVNNYWPPNQLPPDRCYELGVALRRAIESFPGDLRVAVIASGGLSHFVTDETLDRQVLDAMRSRDHDTLRSIPDHLLNAGNSEIRNWIALAGACADREVAWDDYLPVYRTAVGTGVGLAFLRYA